MAFPAAGAGGAQPAPFAIAATSLRQDGQDLVWRLELAGPFSPRALAPDHESLCLLVEHVRDTSVVGQLCIAGPARRSRVPRLRFTPVSASGSGRARAIPASVTRSSPRELTASFPPAAIGLSYRSLRWQVLSAVAPPTCTGTGCSVVFPARPALLALHKPKLVGCVPRGLSWVSHGPSDVHEIALTFDDGPWYDTPQFLKLLEREHVVATFFEVGEHIGQFGEGGAIERRMLADGDMIGDHTWDHRDVASGGSLAEWEISRTARAIRSATRGFRPCLFRAPGGEVGPGLLRVARSLGFATIQWDIDPRDWARPGTAAIYENVIANARDGAIVIQHDGGGDRSETLAALPVEIAALRRRGYRFVTVTQLLGYRLLYR
jgi:peptidoglycan/xylan/chitin deacetylase (PgdA/CDA1 family)